jgi:protein-tyrosine phosphatase
VGDALELSWITDALAIGGTFPDERAADLYHLHRVEAVVDLRDGRGHDPHAFVRHGIELLHLPTPDHDAVNEIDLACGLALVARNLAELRRVLLQCASGVGHSAQLALCVLVEHGYTPLDALTLLKHRRAHVSPSPAQLEAWHRWLGSRGLDAPPFGACARIAYGATV